ncbi:MAG: elongation factor 1-beta [Methermicoccaceae archaeon]
MGEVAAKIRVMPESVDTNLDNLKEEIAKVIPEEAKIHGFSEEDIAFGLKALNVVVMIGDHEGGTEATEQAIEKVKGVESVSVVEVGRLI